MFGLSFTIQDVVIALVGALAVWLFAKAGTGATGAFFRFAKWFVAFELRKAKRARVDAFEVHRAISKESALFISFILSFLIATGFFLTDAGDKSLSSKLVMMGFLMVPTLVLEVCWLLQQGYVQTLLAEAAKLTSNFQRAIPLRPQPERRAKDRETRRKRSAGKKVTYSRLNSRR